MSAIDFGEPPAPMQLKMMGLERSGRGPGRRSFQEAAAAAAGRLPLPLPSSNGGTDGILSSVPIIQPVGHGRHYSPGPLGSCRLPGRRTDAWTGQSVSPISLLPPPASASTGDPGHLDVYYALDEEMRHILMAPAAVRVRECDRIGDDELEAAHGLSVSVLAILCCPVLSVSGPAGGELAHWSLASVATSDPHH